MYELQLVRPSEQYAKQVMSYKEEILQNKNSFDGCAGLKDIKTFEERIDLKARLKEKYKNEYVPSEVFLAARKKITMLSV